MTIEDRATLDRLLANNDVGDIYRIVNKARIDALNDEREKELAKLDELVGRCFRGTGFGDESDYCVGMFPPMTRYFKVISGYCGTSDVQVLTFDEYPTYWWRNHYYDGYMTGNFDYNGINVDCVDVGDLNKCAEISREEFDNAMRGHVDRLLDLKWIRNHNDMGYIWPWEDEFALPREGL